MNGNNKIKQTMKKLFLFGALLCALGMFVACGDKDNSNLIVGKWDVQTYHFLQRDFYQDTSWIRDEATFNLPDTSYIGYDAAEFFADGTMCWHMNDNYYGYYGHEYPEPYLTLRWWIEDDRLLLERGPDSLGHVKWDYKIKELDKKNLVIETTQDDYPYHEYTEDYTFKRRND